MIHSAIHKARPDVMCAAHSHSIYGRSFCTLGRELDITTQDSCAFYNDQVVYEQFNGVVLAEEEGHNIARTLGNKKAAFLRYVPIYASDLGCVCGCRGWCELS